MTLPEAFLSKVLSDATLLPQQKILILALALHPEGLTTKELVFATGGEVPQVDRRSLIQRPVQYLLANGIVIRIAQAWKPGHPTLYQLSLKLRKLLDAQHNHRQPPAPESDLAGRAVPE